MKPDFSRSADSKRLKGALSVAQKTEAASATQDELAALQKKLAQTTLLLEVLAQVNSLMSTWKSFEQFFIEVGKILHERLSFTFIHIWLRDEKDPTMLRLVTPETVDGFRTMYINQGLVGQTVREGRVTIVTDVSQAPEYLNVHPQTKSELCVPVMSDGHSIGAINIETDTEQTFEAQLPVIKVVAENLSHAMKLAILYKTEEQFHQLVDHMSEGVWLGNNEERTIYSNPALQKMIGFSADELRNKISYDWFDEASKHVIKAENEKRKQGLGSHYEATLLSKTGERIPVLVHGVPFGNGGTMSTITDLRALKHAEKRLAHTERFLASITHYCPEAIVGIDEKAIIQSWNMGAEQMFGYKENDVIGNSLEIIIPEDRVAGKELQQVIHEAKTKGSIRNFETVRLHKNGKPISVALTMSAVRDDHGKIIGLSAFYRDITAQKKWEHELQDRFEKMQDAYREMGRQRRYLDYLIDMIGIADGQTTTTKQIATYIVNAIVMITKVDAATLRLLDRGNGKLILTAQSGLGEEWWTKKAISYSGSLVEQAAKQGHPLKMLDILSDPKYTSKALARKNNLRSALVIPLEAKGEVLASLTLYLTHESNLSLLDEEFITVFAKQAALSLKLAG